MLTWSDQEFHALQWWGIWYQYQCERWVNDGQLCPSHLSSINSLVFKLIFSLPKCFQFSSSNVSTSFSNVVSGWGEKCVASLDTSSYLRAAQVPTPPHLTPADRISTANQATLTSLGSYTFQAFPNKGNLSPYVRNHLFTGLDVFELSICFYLSCLSSKFPVCVRNGWNSSQFIGWLLKNLLNVHLSLPSGVDSCQANITHYDPDMRTNPSEALSIHVFFRDVLEIVIVNVWWHCAGFPIVIVFLQWQRVYVDRVSDCNSVYIMTRCTY